MKAATIALAVMAGAAFSGEAAAQDSRRRGQTYTERHCDCCVKLWEYTTLEKREVTTYENVLVGYEDQITGYQDVTVGYQNVWVDRTVTEYETRVVTKRVYVGRDG